MMGVFLRIAILFFVSSVWAGGSKAPKEKEIPPAAKPVEAPKAAALTKGNTGGSTSYRQITDSPEGVALFQRAKSLDSSRQGREAAVLYRQYVNQFPKGQFFDEASYALGLQSFNSNDFDAALPYFGAVGSLDPPSRLRGMATFYQVRSYASLGQRQAALGLLAKLNIQEIPKHEREELFFVWGRIALEEQRLLESSLAFMRSWIETSVAARKNEIEQIIIGLVRDRLNEGELEFLLKEYPEGFPSGYVRLKVAAAKIANGQKDVAKLHLNYVVNTMPPGHSLSNEARALLLRLNAVESVSSAKIGVLLPLSGNQKQVGLSFVSGLGMALEELANPKLDIVQVDVGPSVESALAGFERLVYQEKVMLIVGPFNGPQAEALSSKSASLGVPYVSLSPRDTVLQKGASVFRFALTPEKQVRSLVGFATQKLNAKRFAILFPEDAFGREFAKAYFDVVAKAGGQVTAAESYEPDQSDFKVAIENMVGLGFPSFRKTEREERLKAFEASLDHKATKKELDKANIMPPIVDFDVIFIPDSYKALGQIIPSLLYADIKGPKLLGPSSWHNTQLLLRAGQYLDNSYFVDIFAPEAGTEVTQRLVDKYQLRTGSLPNAFGAMGFDVGLAINKVYQSGVPEDRDNLRSKLEKLGQIEGALGKQMWDKTRDPIAELQLFSIHRGSFQHQSRLSASSF